MSGHRRKAEEAQEANERPTRCFASRFLGTEGSAISEYAVVVGVCGLAISFAILMMGPSLSTAYYQSRQVVIAPVP